MSPQHHQHQHNQHHQHQHHEDHTHPTHAYHHIMRPHPDTHSEMPGGSCGTDAMLSSSKITPLDADVKRHVPHAPFGSGSTGYDYDIDESRIEPLGGHGQYQHPLPHADSQGVVGRDRVIATSKIEPFDHKGPAGNMTYGVDQEMVDKARIEPLSEVREQMD
ncbi:hypothetical protein EJ06DRAFT_215195 [Trichodelitschia bisporula]|uniref:Uncharacterized protein n=1 Tax=Trichodelitschia bisporula TaxID=703511 RepID=A0A6G1I910_9PEZI|nr:hypothetical protein EJ06DRAFT_215195 [Trichodelitschia bisporula]